MCRRIIMAGRSLAFDREQADRSDDTACIAGTGFVRFTSLVWICFELNPNANF